MYGRVNTKSWLNHCLRRLILFYFAGIRGLNPRPVGGGAIWWFFLWFFLNSKKTAARSAAKFSVPSRASIWHLHTKFQVLGHPRSGAIEVKLRSCSSKNEQKSCNLQTLTKARVFKQFQSFFIWSCREKIGLQNCYLDLQNVGFAKKSIFQKLTFFENFDFFFLRFQKFSKNRKICVRPLYLARARQISGRYHFWFPSYNSKKMLSVWWVYGTDPLRPRFWHYDVFYEFLRAIIFMWSCRETIGLENCHLGFSKFWFFQTKILDFLTFYFFFDTFWIFKPQTNLCT